jgi:MFS superfamily sulfate permease-like transporter
MPGESTRRLPKLHVLEGGQHFEIRQHEGVVRVALTGSLDRTALERLTNAVAPRLLQRGQRIVLDGRLLTHLDYRVAGELIDWARALSDYGHTLQLASWSTYLKTILLLADRPLGTGVRLRPRGVPVS